jgi:hypothetical protein
VGDGQFRGVDPGMDVLPALLGERPLESASVLVFQECAESVAQLACTAARRPFDRPVTGSALRAGEPAAEPYRAVGGQVTKPGLAACTVPGHVRRRGVQRGYLQRGHRVPLIPHIPENGIPYAGRPDRGGGRQHRGERSTQVAEFLVAAAG